MALQILTFSLGNIIIYYITDFGKEKTMKIKNGFMLRKVGGQNVVVAVGKASLEFNGIIRLNETGKFLWEQLKNDITEEQLLETLLAEYDIDNAQAKADISEFLEKLRGANLLA